MYLRPKAEVDEGKYPLSSDVEVWEQKIEQVSWNELNQPAGSGSIFWHSKLSQTTVRPFLNVKGLEIVYKGVG